MNISLDYDDTYTQDPDLWRTFIQQAQSRGHQVYCVTWRHAGQPVSTELSRLVLVIYTDLQAKRPYMERLGIPIQVWIDDNPQAILHDYP